LFLVPANGNKGGVRIAKVGMTSANQDVNGALFSADGNRVFFQGDLITNNDTQFYSTTDFTTADQDPAAALIQGVPNGGDVKGFTIRP
jgi:hypothetical protein